MEKVNLKAKPNVELFVYIDVSNPDNPVVLNLEEEALLGIEPNKELPKGVISVRSVWKKPNWLLSQIVEMNCYVDKIFNGKIQRIFDFNALTMARIRVLLQEWDLEKIDPCWKLEHEPSIDSKDVRILSDKSMRMIGEIEPPSLINTMYSKVLIDVLGGGSTVVENFLKKKAEEEALKQQKLQEA